MAGLIPQRPLAEESPEGDWRFVIEFAVQLKAPLDARPKLDSTPSRPPSPDEVPADEGDPATPASPEAALPAALTDHTLAQAQPQTEATR